MGSGLFAGDNLNPRSPEGDGVQFFLTFDLSAVPEGRVVSAMLSSENASVSGTPFKDLEVWPESHWPGFALRQTDVL